MAGLVQHMENRFEQLKSGIHPIVDDWFLMSSPMNIVSIVAVYLLFVLKIGPRLMENRKPFELKSIMLVYNAYQVLISTYLCYHALNVETASTYFTKAGCQKQKPNDPSILLYLWQGSYVYFFTRVVDLLDTVFFILRKKQTQITFLHVFHHTATCFFSWTFIKYAPGEQGIVIGFLNSMVHIFMYSYYLLSALGPKYQKYLWWKKYITALQLIQFCTMLVYLAFTIIAGCRQNKPITYMFVVSCLIYLYLFGSFYRKAYIKNKSIKAEKAKTQ